MINVQAKSNADVNGLRTYIATCSTCRTVTISRRPTYVDDAYCTRCAGRLSWASDLDTAADRDAYPLYCSHCGSIANGAARFNGKKQQRLLARLHKNDAASDALWLRAGTVVESNEGYHRAATARAEALAARRRRIEERLRQATASAPGEQVGAETLRPR